MKIAITSIDSKINSKLDKRFGRCAFFAIYDTESKKIDFINNSNKDLIEDAGIATVKFLVEKGVNKVISSDFGTKIKPILDSYKIQMIVLKEQNITINKIIQMLNH